jgi:hypothetical protein
MKIIAYGSLMNQKSLEKTLGRPAKLTNITLKGWARVFNAPFDGYAFLNLQQSPGKTIKVAYFEIYADEIAKFAKREAGSDLVEVKKGYFAFVWPAGKCQTLPVLQSYIDICRQGAVDLEIDFQNNTILPIKILDDRQAPKYFT